jgi:hypothetical protein
LAAGYLSFKNPCLKNPFLEGCSTFVAPSQTKKSIGIEIDCNYFRIAPEGSNADRRKGYYNRIGTIMEEGL